MLGDMTPADDPAIATSQSSLADGTVTADLVHAAAGRLAGRVRRTPVVDVAVPSVDQPVALKLELLQHTGSFKARGALHRLLTADVGPAGVIAASGGNHGMAVAWAARELGVPAEVFVPETSSRVKVAGIRSYGARVTVTGRFYADAYDACRHRAEESGALAVHAYDDPAVVAGQGTVAVELVEQVPDVDTVLVAVGGGGLAGGITAGLAGRARVVAVEPERIPTLHSALAAGRPVDVEVGGVAADSLGARRIGTVPFAVLSAAAGLRSVLVSDEAVLDARRWLWRELRVVAEPGGAAALAALLCGAYRPERGGERVAVVVCGGNTDPSDLGT